MTTLNAYSATDLAGIAEFGGRAYGVEPLVLPPDPVRGGGGTDPVERFWEPPNALGPPDSADQLFWFRWITGHQLTFILWQELGRRAAEGTAGPAPPDAIRAAAHLMRGYSAMLLYTASCPRAVYHRVVRPGMALYHPGFSGAWARDYGPVRALLRGRLPAGWDGRAGPLLRECALNESLHEGIAAKLVPGEPSLLQSSAGHGRNLPRDTRAALFDTYFLTLRAPCSPSEVTAQLLRRVGAVRDDLSNNGLYPDFASSRLEKPDALATPDVEEIERAIAHLLSVIAFERISSG